MRNTVFVCSESKGAPKIAMDDLSQSIDKLLHEYTFHDAVIYPAQVIVSDTPLGQQFSAYTTVWLPSADNEPE